MGILAVILLVLLACYFLLCIFLALRLRQPQGRGSFPFSHTPPVAGSELVALERRREQSLEELSLQALQARYYGYLLSSSGGQVEASFADRLFKEKDRAVPMPGDAKRQEEVPSQAGAISPHRERLARCGFTADEIDALFDLQKWYQTGGSDRVVVMRHWEFLRFLVRNGRLEA
ncbi:MAG TPA: hypothetical protein VFA09_03985 [Ktedonobacteraceae bacterium]|jgi:hypothetical protein|nr:hypothetical protein [Ktedonobacteraceae bacterium]